MIFVNGCSVRMARQVGFERLWAEIQVSQLYKFLERT